MKSYTSFKEVYDTILKLGYSAVESGAIVANENIEEILTDGWQNLLLKRLTTYKIIDGWYSNSFDKFHEVTIDSESERAAGVVKMLAFDTDFLRKERQRKSQYGDKLPELYYTDGDLTIKYSIKKNDGNKLAVVFQPKWAKVEYIYPNIGKITEDMFDSTMQFNSLQFVNLSKHYLEYDFLYIEDAWNVAGGWYMTNFGNLIYQNVVDFVSKYAKHYDETVALGASKGAYGAYHIGKSVPEISRIGLAGPILSAHDYERVDVSVLRNLSNNYKNKDILSDIKDIEDRKGNITKLVISSGKNDYQYELAKNISKQYEDSDYIDFPEGDHGEIIRESYREVFDRILK